MSGYRVRLARHVEKQLRELPGNVRGRVIAALRVIQNDPTVGIKLRGELAGSRRYRVGGYRIVYQVVEAERLILIENVRHRSRVYRR